MKFVNIFQKGLIADLDNTFVAPDQWVFPTENVRLFDTEGHGLTITNVQGNTNPLTDFEFQLSTGFIPLGKCEYNGILFILSYNPITREGEIGTYPSPEAVEFDVLTNQWIFDPLETGFERVYKPLMMYNWTGNPVTYIPMRSTLFAFSQGYQYSMFVKQKSDYSYDIYIADHNNYNRKINSVFDKDGLMLTDNLIHLEDFPDNIIQVNISKDIINFSLEAVEAGGSLLPGNYFIFVRYTTSTYDRTGFIDDFGPIQVYSGSDTVDIEGEYYTVPTDKRIHLIISNLDTIYPYVEIGIVRYYGELSGEMYDIYLLSDLITNTGTIHLYVTGDQNIEVLTLAELLKPDMKELICKDHLQLWNFYVGANWKEVPYDEAAFVEFAKLVRPTWNCSHTIDDVWLSTLDTYATFGTPKPAVGNDLQYKDYEMTLERTGYLRGEIYPFAIGFKLTDGRIVGAYPIQDWDYYDANNPVFNNTYKGLMRFPARRADYLTPQTQLINDIDKVMGVKFDFANAYAYYAANKSSFKNVIGIYVLRGDRIENFICQGLLYNTVWGADKNNIFNTFKSNTKLFPFINRNLGGTEYIPIEVLENNGTFDDKEDWYYIEDDLEVPEQYYALFSMDDLFSLENKVTDGGTIFLRSQYDLDDTYIFTGINIYPEELTIDYRTSALNTYNINLNVNGEVKVYNIPKGTASGTKGGVEWRSECGAGEFYNRPEEFTLNGTDYDHGFNRYMASTKYIGIYDNDYDFSPLTAHHIVNLYNSDPTDVNFFSTKQTVFSVPNEEYHKISSIMILDDLDAGPVTIWKGDCFLQRTVFRQRFWRVLPDNRDFTDNDLPVGNNYSHGFLISLVTENTINTAMRHDDNEHTYFPKCLEIYDNSITEHLTSENWVQYTQIDAAADEALMYNSGYHRILSPWMLSGYDSTKPYQVTHYPTRIRISAKHVPGTYYDAFMIFDINSYVDFDSINGPINAIAKSLDYLISIQDDSINQHYFSQTEMQPGSEEEYIILGRGPVLSDNVRRIAEFGSQHMNSIVTGMMGVYGVDWKRKIIWRSTPTTSSYGTRYMDAADLTKGKGIRKWMEELSLTQFSDILATFPDTPSLGQGIVSGYDRKFSELLFTFVGPDKTLVFNEGVEIFVSEYTIVPHIYLNINDDFFSSRNSNQVFKHNQGDNLRFYDTMNRMKLSFVVNGNHPEQNTAFLIKLFKSLEILSNNIIFETVEYSTETQNIIVSPFLDVSKFWQLPEYLENKWLVPIVPDVLDRDMRGKWMKVTLTYLGDDKVIINGVVSNYISSNV